MPAQKVGNSAKEGLSPEEKKLKEEEALRDKKELSLAKALYEDFRKSASKEAKQAFIQQFIENANFDGTLLRYLRTTKTGAQYQKKLYSEKDLLKWLSQAQEADLKGFFALLAVNFRALLQEPMPENEQDSQDVLKNKQHPTSEEAKQTIEERTVEENNIQENLYERFQKMSKFGREAFMVMLVADDSFTTYIEASIRSQEAASSYKKELSKGDRVLYELFNGLPTALQKKFLGDLRKDTKFSGMLEKIAATKKSLEKEVSTEKAEKSKDPWEALCEILKKTKDENSKEELKNFLDKNINNGVEHLACYAFITGCWKRVETTYSNFNQLREAVRKKEWEAQIKWIKKQARRKNVKKSIRSKLKKLLKWQGIYNPIVLDAACYYIKNRKIQDIETDLRNWKDIRKEMEQDDDWEVRANLEHIFFDYMADYYLLRGLRNEKIKNKKELSAFFEKHEFSAHPEQQEALFYFAKRNETASMLARLMECKSLDDLLWYDVTAKAFVEELNYTRKKGKNLRGETLEEIINRKLSNEEARKATLSYVKDAEKKIDKDQFAESVIDKKSPLIFEEIMTPAIINDERLKDFTAWVAGYFIENKKNPESLLFYYIKNNTERIKKNPAGFIKCLLYEQGEEERAIVRRGLLEEIIWKLKNCDNFLKDKDLEEILQREIIDKEERKQAVGLIIKAHEDGNITHYKSFEQLHKAAKTKKEAELRKTHKNIKGNFSKDGLEAHVKARARTPGVVERFFKSRSDAVLEAAIEEYEKFEELPDRIEGWQLVEAFCQIVNNNKGIQTEDLAMFLEQNVSSEHEREDIKRYVQAGFLKKEAASQYETFGQLRKEIFKKCLIQKIKENPTKKVLEQFLVERPFVALDTMYHILNRYKHDGNHEECLKELDKLSNTENKPEKRRLLEMLIYITEQNMGLDEISSLRKREEALCLEVSIFPSICYTLNRRNEGESEENLLAQLRASESFKAFLVQNHIKERESLEKVAFFLNYEDSNTWIERIERYLSDEYKKSLSPEMKEWFKALHNKKDPKEILAFSNLHKLFDATQRNGAFNAFQTPINSSKHNTGFKKTSGKKDKNKTPVSARTMSLN